MGNTLSTHMGNTSIVCREISPVPQELLHTSSQAPKGPIDGVCDEVCSSSASRKKCVAGRRRAQKVLPMSMRIVLPMSMRRAVRGKGLVCRLRLSFQPVARVSIPPKIARNQLEYPLWIMRKPPVPLWNNPQRRRVQCGERVGVGSAHRHG